MAKRPPNVNNGTCLGPNVVSQIGYQLLRTTTMPLIDPKLLVKPMMKYFSIHLKPMERPMYKKPYPKWMDSMMPLPKRYKTLYFSTFFR